MPSTHTHHFPSSPHMAYSKPSYKRSVSNFWPKPHPWLHIGEHVALLVPPCHSPAPTTSRHCPTPPSHAARLKLSHERSVSGFWSKPSPPVSCWQKHSPPATSMPFTCTNNLPSLPHTTISHGTPETESPHSVFGFLDPHLYLSHTHSLTTTTTLSTAPHHLSSLPSMAICTGTELVFGFL